jgi:hypothetical protein
MARSVEDEILTLVNRIREQCFQYAEDFASGDIRYQGFEDREGSGRGMIAIHRRKVMTLIEVDVAIGCLLGFYLGNRIRAGGGRAYKWCPFWGTMGTTSAKVTSITRTGGYYTKARVTENFGSQIRGREGWVITNPKEKMVQRMLQLLMIMSFICSCRNKKEEPSSIYTLRKVRTIRGCLEGLTLMI